MSAEPYTTLTVAVGAGAATFFAPCSYALLPGYIGYYVAATDSDRAPLAGAIVRGTAAAVGVLVAFAFLTVVTVIASDLVERALHVIELLVGIILVGLGLAVLRGWTGRFHAPLPKRRASVIGFGFFGILYALASAACVLPVFLGVALRATMLPPTETTVVLGAYGGVVAALMLAATIAIATGRSLGIERVVGFDRLISAAGVLLVLGGIGQLYVALTIS